MDEPVNHVRMTVDLRFEGSYFQPGELVDVTSGWIDSGLEDRDDLVEWKVTGELLPEGAQATHAGRPLAVGDVIHGFAGGIFGRDHYHCTRVVAVGKVWAVCESRLGGVEFFSGRDAEYCAQAARDEPCQNYTWKCVDREEEL